MPDHSDIDKLYSRPLENVEDFVFDEDVVGVFNDMIHRSVPGYDTIISMIGVLAERYVTRGTACYDLGCSLGSVTRAVLAGVPHNEYKIIAVDNSRAMIERLSKLLITEKNVPPVEVICTDIRNIIIENASFVVLNFVLQFLPAEERFSVLEKIYKGLMPGGVFVLSEKIRFDRESEQNFQIDMHHEFKKLNGYSELEISQKRTALEKILLSDSIELHRKRLADAGFQDIYIWFQCFNFVSIVAFR